MANTIILKRSATPGKVPTTGQLALGEIAINTYDGLIYIKKDDGTQSIAQIGGVTSVNGETGAITIDTGDVAENGNQYFTQSRARASLSGTGAVSYNSSTGVITTTQNLTTAGTPSFAGITLTGGISSIAGDIIPSADVTYDLGSPTKQWKDIYVGPGSLYVNGSKVLEDDTGTITFSADADQNIRIKTLGAGILQLGSSTTNINIDGTLQIAAGKNITDSAGIKVNFGDSIEMNGNKVIGLGAPSANGDAATKLYVDTAIGAVSTSSIAQGNTNISVVDSGTGTVTVTVDGSTALTVDATGVVVAGNFTVSGTTTTVNSNTVSVADNIITLNSDATGAPSQNAGIEVERGDETNTQIRWNEGSDTWTFTNDGAVYYPISTSTDVLAEGTTNLYHTAGRARAAISASSATGVSYNSTTGAISLGSIPNSSLANNSITINGTSVALGGTRTLDTDAVSEGSTNLYFTNTRARGAVSVTDSGGDGSLSYNSSTGVITYTGPSASEVRAHFTAGTGITITSGAIATTITQYTDTLARGAVSFTAGSGAYNSTTGVFTIPTNTNQLTNGAGFATESFVTSAVAGKDNTSEIAEGSNLYFTDARARAAVSFTAGSGAYNSSTGVFTIPTNTNQLTNGAGYVTSSGVTAVTATGPVASSGGATPVISMPAATASVDGYMTSTFASKLNGIAAGATNVTNTNQLTNGAGYITGYTETDTLSSVTGRGASTGTAITISNSTASSSKTTGALIVTGGVGVSGAMFVGGEITAYASDAALKTNVEVIENALEKVEAIRGVSYDWNTDGLALGLTDAKQIGVIAQEVEAVIPELVCDSAHEGYKTVKYDKLTALLIEAVKELSAKVKTLEAQLGGKPGL